MFQQRSLTLVFAVKFWFVFRRYVLALLPVRLWRRFKARKFYLGLNWSKKIALFIFFFENFAISRACCYGLTLPSPRARVSTMRRSFPVLSRPRRTRFFLPPKRLNFEPSQIIKSVISCATRA